MSSPAKAHEPSMEEILASIRRIIADDQAAPAPAGAAEPEEVEAVVTDFTDARDARRGFRDNAAEAGHSDEILELTDPMEPRSAVDGDDEIEFRDPEPPARPAPDLAALAAEARKGSGERLLSPSTDSVVSAAFNVLTHTVLAENSRTLEDLVHEMLQPMLKTWLDDNLPALVERLIRQEIEHVSRGGRR